MARFVKGDVVVVKSNIRPNRIFTSDQKIIIYKVGHLKKEIITETVRKIIDILSK